MTDNIPPLKDIPPSSRTNALILKRYPKLYEELDKLPEELSIKEKLYWYYNGIVERPVCKVCGKPVKFINSSKGYSKHCSSKCSNGSETTKRRKKEAYRERYGVDNPQQCREIREKSKCTIEQRYGVDNVSKNPDIKEKKRQKNLERAGVPCNFYEKSPYLMEFEPNKNGEYKYKCSHPNECDKCNEKWFLSTPQLHCIRLEFKTEPCTRLLPYNAKVDNNTIELYIKSILDESGVKYVQHDRSILNGKELDFFIPEHNIAIECNGMYWHSDIYKHKTYHYDKWKLCKEQNIQLLTFWEDQIKHKPDIVKSVIKSKLGIYEIMIGARECELKDVGKEEAKEFLKNNHLQGYTTSKVRIGLYYGGELVSIMTFGKQRKCMNQELKEGSWELYRFCNKTGWIVKGGASRLFKHFLSHYNPAQITSFASHDISDGSLYERVLGFNKIREQKYSYWYIDNNSLERYHRYTFNKKELAKRGADESLTERQIMASTNYFTIYDSGQTTFLWTSK